MRTLPGYVRGLLVGVAVVVCMFFLARAMSGQNRARTILLEVVRNSWDAQRNETLLYLRVYSDGSAEADPMRKVDFRHLRLATKHLSADQLGALKHLLFEPVTMLLQPNYSRSWGDKDFGYKYTLTIYGRQQKRLELVNFQPFLAREKGKSYPKQLEKLGCQIWKLRAEVTAEPLEKDWLNGCTELGY